LQLIATNTPLPILTPDSKESPKPEPLFEFDNAPDTMKDPYGMASHWIRRATSMSMTRAIAVY
jgi:hypothetical protein